MRERAQKRNFFHLSFDSFHFVIKGRSLLLVFDFLLVSVREISWIVLVFQLINDPRRMTNENCQLTFEK
jgi:hypothetical protein